MYLNHIFIENSGPIRKLDSLLSFFENGNPKPVILVGANGSGKTNVLSIIADAIFEAAAVHYSNVLPSVGLGRAWFRIVGGRTTSTGAPGGFSLLKFDDAGTARFYREKGGSVDPTLASQRVPTDFSSQLGWETEGAFKSFDIDDARSKKLFRSGVYNYFPSNRSEIPYWLNRSSIEDPEFDLSPTFDTNLKNEIYISSAIHKFTQWIISLMTDSRVNVSVVIENEKPTLKIIDNPTNSLLSGSTLDLCNKLIQSILGISNARFVWTGRHSQDKVAIAVGSEIVIPSLGALSSGQSLLLGLFGTIARHGDYSSSSASLDFGQIEGICIIDEIDSHIHIDLQNNALPKLIRLFPKIQFICSSHSPIFVLGMDREFGKDSLQILELPTGLPVEAENYSEFGAALNALSATNEFTKNVIIASKSRNKPVVYVEGETDAPYLIRAAQLLDQNDILSRCDIEWIGGKDQNMQGFNTGKDALKHIVSLFRANPQLANRNILALNDNDSRSPDVDYEAIIVRTLPINPNNTKVKAGIENLLSEDIITDDFYQLIEKEKPNGDLVITRTLRKADLCRHACAEGTVDQFAGFEPALSIISEFLRCCSPSAAPQTAPHPR